MDKANVLKSFAFFRRVFDEVAAEFPDVAADHLYVDAAALELVRRPERFDVIVTENLLGDILSDLAAGLVGGMGVAPSADLGDRHAVFQPCHGTAPDLAGQGHRQPRGGHPVRGACCWITWAGPGRMRPRRPRRGGSIAPSSGLWPAGGCGPRTSGASRRPVR